MTAKRKIWFWSVIGGVSFSSIVVLMLLKINYGLILIYLKQTDSFAGYAERKLQTAPLTTIEHGLLNALQSSNTLIREEAFQVVLTRGIINADKIRNLLYCDKLESAILAFHLLRLGTNTHSQPDNVIKVFEEYIQNGEHQLIRNYCLVSILDLGVITQDSILRFIALIDGKTFDWFREMEQTTYSDLDTNSICTAVIEAILFDHKLINSACSYLAWSDSLLPPQLAVILPYFDGSTTNAKRQLSAAFIKKGVPESVIVQTMQKRSDPIVDIRYMIGVIRWTKESRNSKKLNEYFDAGYSEEILFWLWQYPEVAKSLSSIIVKTILYNDEIMNRRTAAYFFTQLDRTNQLKHLSEILQNKDLIANLPNLKFDNIPLNKIQKLEQFLIELKDNADQQDVVYIEKSLELLQQQE